METPHARVNLPCHQQSSPTVTGCGAHGTHCDSGLLVISNLALLPAVGFALSKRWWFTTALMSASMFSSIMYHGAAQNRHRVLDVTLAGCMLVYMVGVIALFCTLPWGCAAIAIFVVAIAFFLYPAPSTGVGADLEEYQDPSFCVTHSLWHLYGGAAVICVLYGSKD
jgi:hypothetical protein